MDDLDDVRRALGYQRINLAGASYGTIAAQVYMRQHPDRVHAAFLAGVATPAFKLPLPFARAAQHAWERVAADCAADAACQTAFPKLQDEFSALLARFDAGPLQVQMTDPADAAAARGHAGTARPSWNGCAECCTRRTARVSCRWSCIRRFWGIS